MTDRGLLIWSTVVVTVVSYFLFNGFIVFYISLKFLSSNTWKFIFFQILHENVDRF